MTDSGMSFSNVEQPVTRPYKNSVLQLHTSSILAKYTQRNVSYNLPIPQDPYAQDDAWRPFSVFSVTKIVNEHLQPTQATQKCQIIYYHSVIESS